MGQGFSGAMVSQFTEQSYYDAGLLDDPNAKPPTPQNFISGNKQGLDILAGAVKKHFPPAQVAPSTTSTSTPPDAPGAPPPTQVPIDPPHPDVSVVGDRLPMLPMRYPGNAAFLLGGATGTKIKEVAHDVSLKVDEFLDDTGKKWESWKSTLPELLADVKWVGYAIGVVILGYVLVETYPVWSLVWDALLFIMDMLKSALRVLGWVWDGFTELMQEIWQSLRQLGK
ncbi:MAG: hypothetical protein KGQ60_10660 [Planctomycetes bacterium]|nr:hypothetical protein [Planctomycetota bacterium]